MTVIAMIVGYYLIAGIWPRLDCPVAALLSFGMPSADEAISNLKQRCERCKRLRSGVRYQ
jgi:hypothetical protein